MAEEKQKLKLTGDQVAQVFENERAKLQMLERELTALGNARRENENAKASIEALEKSEKDNPLMVSVGGPFFIEAKYKKSKKVKKLLAGKAMVDMSIEDAKKEIERAKEEMGKSFEKLSADQQITVTNLRNLSKLVDATRQAMAKKKQGK